MGWLIGVSILGIIAAVAFIVRLATDKEDDDEAFLRGVAGVASGVAVVVGIVVTIFSSFYPQDPGEAKVLRSITGDVVGETYESGLHGKAPWVSAETWDIRENTISYVASGEESYDAGSVTGPRITVQDRDGVKSDLDVTVRYSIEGDQVSELYSSFGSQEAVTNKVIQPAIRSAVRKVPGTYSTLDLVLERVEIEGKIEAQLTDEWRRYGITVDGIDMQEIVLPTSINEANAEKAAAQAAIETQKAKNDQQDLANDQKIDNAKAEATANREISKSLTDDLIRLRQIEAYKDGTVYVVPDGTTPFLQPK